MIERIGAKSREELRRAYNELHARHEIGDSRRFYRWILRLMRPEREASLLDIGCGRGGLMEEAERLGLLPYGLDIADRAVALCRKRTGSARLVVADGEALPFRDGAFRYVANLGNLEHFLHPPWGVREMARILHPDGLAAVMLPNSFYSGDIWRLILSGYGPTHHQVVERFATVNEWRDLLEEGGLRVEKIVRYNKFKLLKALLPFNLAYHFVYLCRRG